MSSTDPLASENGGRLRGSLDDSSTTPFQGIRYRSVIRLGPALNSGLCAAAALAVLVADPSGLSKAEVERIWLPFAVWLIARTGLLPARQTRA